MTREKMYEDQLRSMGVWQDAFRPVVHDLAMLEREHQRAMKRWKSADGGPAASGDPTSPLYAIITQQRRDIQAYRDTLGLTPKALRRLMSRSAEEAAADSGVRTASPVTSELLSHLRAAALASSSAPMSASDAAASPAPDAPAAPSPVSESDTPEGHA